jgi:hypothetical protein
MMRGVIFLLGSAMGGLGLMLSAVLIEKIRL